MVLKKLKFTIIALAFSLMGGGESFSQQPEQNYFPHPPELSVPDGEPGQIRRAIMQFNNWTLICDEDLPAKKQVCNVTQSIVDRTGNVVFSWSLAASDNGQPFFLLRALPTADKTKPIQMFFQNRKEPVNIDYVDCNESLCLAQTRVGPVLSAAIDTGAMAFISYPLQDGSNFQFYAPLKGLKEAVQSIK
ncbi:MULTISPECIES: invasion associated locus B family protein [unclassified Bartonella]|uniref:invasion associated locus B family protein n=1 Tax=unclassified Bartonella TaxID=2645622 RepID=UPI0015FE2945|nr:MULTISPECIES: invasion associated locus B family protein [unclassified Bartonella]UXN03920.1 invasion associated locus B family protein [Bartonella sp. HY406]UXN06901.1 invasion associated locus B family protein [Bartonella sp. HY761]